MTSSVADQVIEFYNSLFEQIYSQPFRPEIQETIKRRDVIRQIEASADAASQSLARFFLNEQLNETTVSNILTGYIELPDLLKLEDIANPNVTPETVVEDLITKLPCPRSIKREGKDAVYRVALHSVVQGLMLVGPVMARELAGKFKKINSGPAIHLKTWAESLERGASTRAKRTSKAGRKSKTAAKRGNKHGN